MMKKIILYLNILMSLLITSCSNEDIALPTPQSGADGETCEISFWASIPETSSASRGDLGEATKTSVETLTLLVFDAESGLYLYKSLATLSNQTLKNGIHKGKYKVQLRLSDKPLIVHFVANVEDVPFQANELAVLSQLTKGDNQDAYWQRTTVSSITADIQEGGTSAPGITDTTIKLVRNFARVTLTAATNSGFTLEGFVLVNTADKGTVAPYTMKEDVNGNYFPTYVTENDANGSAMTKYEDLIEAGYTGVQPSDAKIVGSVPDENSNLYTTADKYLYERTQEENPVFLIAKRKMTNGSFRYYKIDIIKKGGTGEKDDYYKILRNFSYDITINSVEGDGYETPAEAAAATASNNLSASLELRDLTNIAYGDERLFVSKTEIVWTSADPITFKYKYLKDGVNSNTSVTSLILGEAKNSSGAVCSSYTISSRETDADGYSTISITHTGLPVSGYKEQEVTIKAGTLMRAINLILVQPYATTLGCSSTSGLSTVPTTIPEIPLTVGSPVYVYFSLPANLPESIFPLTFILSPDAHSITPTGGDMPVTSLLTHANTTMQGLKYGFEKVITWNAYKNNVTSGMIVECPFKTSLAESATNIYLYNEYFNTPLYTSFTNPMKITLEGDENYGQNNVVTLKFIPKVTGNYQVVITENGNITTQNFSDAQENVEYTYQYEHKTFNSDITVTIKLLDEDGNVSETIDVQVDERTQLLIKPASIKYEYKDVWSTEQENVQNGKVSISGTYTDTEGNTQTISDSATGTELTNGVYIYCPKLNNMNSSVTLSYSRDRNTYSATITLQDLYSESNVVLR